MRHLLLCVVLLFASVAGRDQRAKNGKYLSRYQKGAADDDDDKPDSAGDHSKARAVTFSGSSSRFRQKRMVKGSKYLSRYQKSAPGEAVGATDFEVIETGNRDQCVCVMCPPENRNRGWKARAQKLAR